MGHDHVKRGWKGVLKYPSGQKGVLKVPFRSWPCLQIFLNHVPCSSWSSNRKCSECWNTWILEIKHLYEKLKIRNCLEFCFPVHGRSIIVFKMSLYKSYQAKETKANEEKSECNYEVIEMHRNLSTVIGWLQAVFKLYRKNRVYPTT